MTNMGSTVTLSVRFVFGRGEMVAVVDIDNVNNQEEPTHCSVPQLSADMGPGDTTTQVSSLNEIDKCRPYMLCLILKNFTPYTFFFYILSVSTFFQKNAYLALHNLHLLIIKGCLSLTKRTSSRPLN